MDYQKHYESLINSRKQMNRVKSKDVAEIYFEDHHIVPKCLGGSNKKENVILLTAREHYIAHWLLWKATRNTKLAFAFISMAFTNKNNRRLTSIQYERARQVQRDIISDYNKGKKRTPEQIEKIRQTHLGSKRCEETKQKMKEAWKKRRLIPVSEETRQKISDANTKTWQNNEELREAARRRKIEYNKIFNTTEFTCPYCGKIGKGPNMKRYHFDKCKEKKC